MLLNGLLLFTSLVFLLACASYNMQMMQFRIASLALTMLPLFWSLGLWMFFDASGAAFQFVETLPGDRLPRESITQLGSDVVTALATLNAEDVGAGVIISAQSGLHLSFGIDSVGLSLVVLTASLFPLCVSLMRTFTGIMTFLLLEVVILGALTVLDLLGFYILFEASLILLFLLIARTPYGSMDAAYKIVLYTMAGSLVLLPVIFMLYTECGSTNLFVLMNSYISPERQTLLGWGMLAVFAVKIPLMPLHLWLPEAHVAAPTAGSVLLAGVLLKLGGIGFIRFMIPVVPAFTVWVFPLVACMCLCSFLFSTLSTIRQIDLKKIVAYSSIAHMSLVTLTIFSMSEFSTYSSTFMMVAHGLVSPGLFLLVGFLYERAHTKFILYFSGLGAYMPIFSVFFFLLTCANLSFPLFPNFVAEVLCLASLFAVHEIYAYIFCVCQVLGAVYAFWSFNRVIHGVAYSQEQRRVVVPAELSAEGASAGSRVGMGVNTLCDLTRFEFALITPLMVAVLWLGIKPMA